MPTHCCRTAIRFLGYLISEDLLSWPLTLVTLTWIACRNLLYGITLHSEKVDTGIDDWLLFAVNKTPSQIFVQKVSGRFAKHKVECTEPWATQEEKPNEEKKHQRPASYLDEGRLLNPCQLHYHQGHCLKALPYDKILQPQAQRSNESCQCTHTLQFKHVLQLCHTFVAQLEDSFARNNNAREERPKIMHHRGRQPNQLSGAEWHLLQAARPAPPSV